LADKTKELRIRVLAGADPSVQLTLNNLTSSYRRVRDEISDPLEMSLELKGEATLKSVRDLRKRVEDEFNKTKLRVQAELIAPEVRKLAGLRSEDTPRLQRAAILQSSLHENLSALSQEDFDARSSERRARVVRERDSEVSTKTGLVPEVAEEPAHIAARQAETIRQREAEEQRRRDVLRQSILGSNAPGRDDIRNQEQVREFEREQTERRRSVLRESLFDANRAARSQADAAKNTETNASEFRRSQFEQERPRAIKSLFESNVPAATERNAEIESKQRFEQAKPNIFAQLLEDQKEALSKVELQRESARAHVQATTEARVEARSPEDQALREAKQRILKNLRDQAAIYQRESSAIEAEIKARMELFGESRRKASKAVNAKERLEDLNNAVPAGAQGAAGGGNGGNGPLGSAFANIRGLLGRYSAVAQAFQALRASGPFLAVGLAVHEAEQISSAWLKTTDAVRTGKISAGEASDEFARAIPVVGSIYAIIQDTTEALTGEKAAIRLINENIDESRRRMHDATKAAAEWGEAIKGIQDRTNLIGLGNPAADIERQRQERTKAIADAESIAAQQVAQVRSPDAEKARQQHLEANKVEEDKLRNQIDDFRQLAKAAKEEDDTTEVGKQERNIRDAEKRIVQIQKENADARGEVAARSQAAQAGLNKTNAARNALDVKENTQRDRSAEFQSYVDRAELQRKFYADVAQERERNLRLAALAAHNDGEQTLAIEKKYQADSLANAAKTTDASEKLRINALGKLRELVTGFDFGKTETIVHSQNNPATGQEEKTVEQKFVPGDAAANRQQFQRVKDSAKSFWQDLTNIWKGGSDEQRKIDEQRKEDRQRLLDQDADTEFHHQQHIKDIQTAAHADRLKAMGLDFEAGVAERKRAEDRELDEIKQHLKEQMRVRKDHADELKEQAKKDAEETRKAFEERNRLATIEYAHSARGDLPNLTESLTGTGAREASQERLTAELYKSRLARGGLDANGNLVGEHFAGTGSSGGDFGGRDTSDFNGLLADTTVDPKALRGFIADEAKRNAAIASAGIDAQRFTSDLMPGGEFDPSSPRSFGRGIDHLLADTTVPALGPDNQSTKSVDLAPDLKDTAKHTDETTQAVNKLIEYMKIRFGQGPATFNQSQPALTPN
jgi:hypothetical protein